MNKVWKKFSSLLLITVLAFVFSMAVSAADSIIGNSDDTGSIVVKGIDAETDNTNLNLYAVPIVKASYDAKGNFSGYELVYKNYNSGLNIANIEQPTEAELTKIAATLTEAQMKGADNANLMNVSGADYTKTVGVGMYLIMVQGAEAKSYNVATASVNYVNSAGTANTLTNGQLTMATAIGSGVTWIKKSSQPGLDKTVKIGTGFATNGNTAKIGDVLTYEVKIPNIPYYGGEYPKLKVNDTLSDGLDYVQNSLSVKIYDGTTLVATLTGSSDSTDDRSYTLSVSGRKIEVDFVKTPATGKKYKLNTYAGKTAVIEYQAKLNASAKVNEKANSNTVELSYSKDSKINGEDGEIEKKTYTYTFEIDANLTGTVGQASTIDILRKCNDEKKADGSYKDTPLANAEFTLYTADPTGKTDAEKTAIKYTNTVEGTGKAWTNPIVTDTAGQLHMKGLAAGTYYLQETKAPSGYTLNTHVFKIVIATEHYDDGQLKNWTVTVDDATTPTACFDISQGTKTSSADTRGQGSVTSTNPVAGTIIYNTTLKSLPSTGGMGTYLFTVVGVALMAAAAFLLIRRRKTDNE